MPTKQIVYTPWKGSWAEMMENDGGAAMVEKWKAQQRKLPTFPTDAGKQTFNVQMRILVTSQSDDGINTERLNDPAFASDYIEYLGERFLSWHYIF